MFPANIKKVETNYCIRTIITRSLYLVSQGKDRLYQIIHIYTLKHKNHYESICCAFEEWIIYWLFIEDKNLAMNKK